MSSTLDASDAALAATSFADLGVPAPMAGALARRGISAPFPIQIATIPDALAGRDLCGRAPTGSGKTIAFGIPLVLGVGKARSRRPRGLVLVPTRELASQVAHELQQLSKPKGPWIEAFYGGVGFPRQVQALQRGVDIVVACPGRLADLINQGCADLRDVDFVVIDEADRMADMGFLPEVRRLLDQCANDRQTLLFSATLDGDVDVLITRYQRDPARYELYHDDEDASRATHLFWNADRSDRISTTAAVVARSGPTVVFCRTKRGADRVARQLESAGVSAAAIHGDRSQAQRERALRSFHKGEVDALVATDVAARGIHVDDVACVVHFDPPHDAKDYVHRSGRTARAGASGLVVSLVLPDVRKDVKRLQRDLELPVGFTAADPDSIESAPPTARRDHGGRRSAGTTTGEVRAERPSSAGRRADDRPTRSTKSYDRPKRNGPSRNGGPSPRPKSSGATAGPRNPSTGSKPQTDRNEAPRRAQLEPLPDGKRRPSGAARRKAKRLAAYDLGETTPNRSSGRRPTGKKSGPTRSTSSSAAHRPKSKPAGAKTSSSNSGPRRASRPAPRRTR